MHNKWYHLPSQHEAFNVMKDKLGSDLSLYTLLHGKSGVGKTSFVKEVSNRLCKEYAWKCIYCPCSDGHTIEPYHAFEIGIETHKTEISRKIKETSEKLLVEAAKDIPLVGNTTSCALDLLINSNLKSRKAALSGRILTILSSLKEISGTKRLLVVIDDVQWLDPSSFELLRIIRKKETLEEFSFLSNISFVFIFAEGKSGRSSSDLSYYLKFDNTIHLPGCEKDELRLVLSESSISSKDFRSIANIIWNVSGSHLKIAKEIAGIISEKIIDCRIDSLSRDYIFRSALEKKIDNLGTHGITIKKILRKASIIGDGFTINEITCLYSNSDLDIVNFLEDAEREEFISISGRHVYFAHSSVKDYFRDINEKLSISDHEKFTECLKAITPSAYALRAFHSKRAGLLEEFEELYLISLIQRMKAGEDIHINEEPGFISLKNVSLIEGFGLYMEAESCFSAGSYDECIGICDKVIFLFPILVSTEASILKARALIKSSYKTSTLQAISVLMSALKSIPKDELDLRGRVQLYLLVAQSYQGDIDAARNVFKDIKLEQGSRVSFDKGAREILSRAYSRADMFLNEDIAGNLIQEALNGIRSTRGSNNPVQYYVVLCNFTGNLIYRGRFREAKKVCGVAESLMRKNIEINFPRVDILINNQIISGVFSSYLNKGEMPKLFEELVKSHKPNNDSMIIRSNYAASLCLNKSYDDALAILAKDYKILCENDNSDDFEKYYVGNNLAGALYQKGKKDMAYKVWNMIASIPDQLPISIRPFMIARHELMSDVFRKKSASWDVYSYPHLRNRFGSIGRFLGRGFLFSELQFWSDE